MSRVLVIEDSPTQAQQLALVLEDAGFEVETAPDAERGFGRLVEGRFDVVLSDLHLPGDSGFDLCRKIKGDARLRRTPVLVCTSQADPVNVLRGLEAGADGFMTKGRDPAEIVAGLRRVLARAAAPAEGPPTVVAFLDQEFALTAGREQLLDVLVTAFEDVVRLNRRCLEAARSERLAHEELKRAESQLVQAEKLSALGRVVAGVAHEINNPLAFVTNNVAVVGRDLDEIRELIRLYRQADPELAEHRPDLLATIRDRAERIDLDYTLENLGPLMARSSDGLKRIHQIVKDLRNFARLDESDLQEVDLNAGVASTLNILRGEAEKRQVALIEERGRLPAVTCYPARINQVILNLVANAIEACAPGGRVTITTRPADGGVELVVGDDGRGIEPSVRDKIFEPFFTTKPVGQGTGLGLSISYAIVRDHGGRIEVESAPGRGSRFTVRLPCKISAPEPPRR